ncbi:DUF551 domain-containing protein [Klebsiella aerogenes]
MTNDITELAQREKFEAWWERTQHNGNPPRFGWEYWRDGEGYKVDDDESELDGMWEAWRTAGADLVEALENAQAKIIELQKGCENDPRTHEIIDLQERIAELESRTVKLPVHPTIASEKLDDETLQELIEFRRTTFEYHSKEGNRVQTIIHGVTLAALRELQERRKTEKDSEPVCFVSERNLATLTKYRAAVKVKAEPVMVRPVALYRHAQQPVVPDGLRLALSNAGIAAPESDEMLAATCEKHIQALVTWVKDRKPFQSAPVVPSFEEWLSAANRKPLGWVKDAMREAYDACRAAMLQAGNSPVIPDGYRLQPISEYEAMCATVNSDEWPQRWIPVSERMPERGDYLVTDGRDFDVQSFDGEQFIPGFVWEDAITHWMPLPAAPQEVK